MSRMELTSFNTVYADKHDTIFYVSNGLIPVRDPSIDFTRTVAGNTKKALWTKYHDFKDLPQQYNPASGFLFNTNHSPFNATEKKENLKTLYNLGVTKKSIRTIFFTQGIIITFFGLMIGLILAIGIVLLQQQFSLIMITPTMPYPVVFDWRNIFTVLTTITVLGIISSWIASGTANKGI